MSEIIDFPTKVEPLPLEDEQEKKVTLVDKDGNAAQMDIGNMYDVNKGLMEKEPTLSKSKIRKKVAKIVADVSQDTCYMLLCRELTDYTVFIYTDDVDEFKAALRDCIINRGECKGIDKQPDGAWEIWLKINDEMHAYYLFNCNQCIIPC